MLGLGINLWLGVRRGIAAATSRLLLESGDALLLEDGTSFLVLE